MKKYVSYKLWDAAKASILSAGLFVLLAIAASTPAYREIFYVGRWTLAGIGEVFLAIVLLGGVLGWHFPKEVEKYCSRTTVVLFSGLVLGTILLTGLLFLISEHLSTPHQVKLADCTGNKVNVHLNAPPGRHYVLELNSPGLGRMANGSMVSSYKFTGYMRIMTDDSQITNIPLNSDKMFVFPSGLSLSTVNLQGGKTYDLEIEFNPPPPSSSFISLDWMQNPADRNHK